MMSAPSGQEHIVKKSKFTGEQIAFSLKQAELGTRVEEVCRKIGNLLTNLRRAGRLVNAGTRAQPIWSLAESKKP